MNKIYGVFVFITLFGIAFVLVGLSSCSDDNGGSSVNHLIMEMKLVNIFQEDTTEYTFSYMEGVLKQATIAGKGINRSYTADVDSNGKVIEAGNKRFEWDGDQLIKIIDDNGIWTDLTYDGDKLTLGEYFDFDQNNEIRKRGTLTVNDNGMNLSGIDNANASDQVFARHVFAGFDNKANVFKAIWWFHYVAETMGSFRSGSLPDALYMENNPGSYTYELPLQPFERTINYQYTYDDQGRVVLIEYDLGADSYNLIIAY